MQNFTNSGVDRGLNNSPSTKAFLADKVGKTIDSTYSIKKRQVLGSNFREHIRKIVGDWLKTFPDNWAGLDEASVTRREPRPLWGGRAPKQFSWHRFSTATDTCIFSKADLRSSWTLLSLAVVLAMAKEVSWSILPPSNACISWILLARSFSLSSEACQDGMTSTRVERMIVCSAIASWSTRSIVEVVSWSCEVDLIDFFWKRVPEQQAWDSAAFFLKMMSGSSFPLPGLPLPLSSPLPCSWPCPIPPPLSIPFSLCYPVSEWSARRALCWNGIIVLWEGKKLGELAPKEPSKKCWQWHGLWTQCPRIFLTRIAIRVPITVKDLRSQWKRTHSPLGPRTCAVIRRAHRTDGLPPQIGPFQFPAWN